MESKNPREIAYIVRKSTFAVFDGLTEADMERSEEPLTLHASTFSRFKFLLISAEKKSVTANINVRDIFGIIKKSNIALKKDVDYIIDKENREDAATEDDASAPAYNVKFTSGKLRGLTPAEVLLTRGEEGAEKLTSQYEFLERNLSQYKWNQAQMDAIIDAFTRYDNHTLAKQNVQKKCEIPLYDGGIRPLVRKKDADGRSFIYEIRIGWILGESYPVEITIKNYYAPVVKTNEGLYNVRVSQKDPDSEIENTMYLSASEWAYVAHMMDTDIKNFERCIYQKKRKEADKYEAENRKKAGIENSHEGYDHHKRSENHEDRRNTSQYGAEMAQGDYQYNSDIPENYYQEYYG